MDAPPSTAAPHRPRATETDIRLEGVTKRYGAVAAVDGVTLDVPPGAFVSLLGPSGCGKTTLLRLVGGFETPDAGHVHIGGADVTGRPPQARPTAMVFQSYALFPTMTVGENVAYGLRVRRVPKRDRAEQVQRALRRVDLDGLEERPVTALSGGQQQRVALARALAVAPAVLLFDEPLSNLDQALREQTRAELKRLQAALGTTSLYVTHDQQEALALSDQIAVMRAGRIVEAGPPETLYAAPGTAYVARFLGGANVVAGPLAERLAGERAPDGQALAVRPEALAPAEEGEGAVPAQFIARQFLGTHAEWTVTVEESPAGEGVPLRLWTAPETAVPDRLFLRATRTRWVRREGDEGV